MTPKNIYRLRRKLKRWTTQRDDLQAELAQRRAAGEGEHNFSWVLSKLRELDLKIPELAAIDLRTDEEKRGTVRKKYERTKPIEFRGIPDEQIAKIERSQVRLARRYERERVELDRLISIPGSPQRQAEYDRRSANLRSLLRFHKHAKGLMAKQAVAERHGGELDLPEYQRAAIKKLIDLLAQMTDLDHEFADCDTGYLTNPNPGMRPDPDRNALQWTDSRGRAVEPTFDKYGKLKMKRINT